MYKLLSHSDLDGVGCGILAKLAFENQVKVRYNSISSLNHEVESFLEKNDKNTFLFITDLAVNEENEKKLNEYYQTGGKLQLIDHHQTALHFNDYDWGHVVVKRDEGTLTSATSLFYEYLINHNLLAPSSSINEFVELVRQYDTWEWEKRNNREAQRLNSLFFLVATDEFEEKMIHRLKNHQHFFFDELEEKILDMEQNKMERYIHRKRRELVQAPIGKFLAGIVYAESYHSDLGNQLGKECSHLDYIAIINIGGKRIGFRTIHDHVDVSKIASHYGGGGHAKASGCSLNKETFKHFVTSTFHLEPFREDERKNKYNIKSSPSGSLYSNRKEETFFLFPNQNDQKWVIEHNRKKLKETFLNFDEAERFLKRKHAAWLVKDELFESYIMNSIKDNPILL
ncbi:DHH family phosphoesterase [Jeotgalibacillus soli]|uniref:Oligoribonuclease NrnB C-terminal domain-containing protein n=1 Tax=Jeotgalibacillus soli TaxID=889306 RepID=A0A0C2VK87_9BACL|nr:oligoribonuclease [Jeotgalibacillus soli]KIL49327.1 hypothetical protein KP78_07950 [Jeotgalibacillus soli]